MSAKAFCICRRLLLPGLAVLLTLLLCLSAWLLADGGPSPLGQPLQLRTSGRMPGRTAFPSAVWS